MLPCDWDSFKDYKRLIGPLRQVARDLGYCLAVHGTLKRDIDLLAAPWRDKIVSARELAEAIRAKICEINGAVYDNPYENTEYFLGGHPGYKSHFRLCWSFHLTKKLGQGPYVDLSVMPRTEGLEVLEVNGRKAFVWYLLEPKNGTGA